MSAYAELCRQLKQQPRRWMVTGAAGFVGSNLVEALLKLDQNVVGLDNFSNGFSYNVDDIRANVSAAQWSRFQFVDGDARDPEACRRSVEGADCVLHQAALGSVPRSIADPWSSHDSNVNGQMQILLAARDAKVKRVVYASSSSVYGDHPGLPKVEDRIGDPLSPYAATKRVNELYADVMARTYGMSIAGLRYFNVFGRRQNPIGAYAAVIPTWFAALRKSLPIEIFGDGETSRDFCYIANVVQANLLAGSVETLPRPHEVFNVAAGAQTSLKDLFELIRAQVALLYPEAADAQPVYRAFRPGDVRHSLADVSKAERLLGYVPTHGVDVGIAETASWYLDPNCPAVQ